MFLFHLANQGMLLNQIHLKIVLYSYLTVECLLLLKKISFEEATLIIRTTLIDKKEEIPFEEAEEDDMDENCVIGCSPSEHYCGK